jgi:predicted RNase H-like HicB family nuclease
MLGPRSRNRPLTAEGGTAMDAYEVELESVEPEEFVVTIPSLPGLLILGATIDEVLVRTRASIAFHVRAADRGQLTEKIALVVRPYQPRP